MSIVSSFRERRMMVVTVALIIVLLVALVLNRSGMLPHAEHRKVEPGRSSSAAAYPDVAIKCNARIVYHGNITVMTWTAGCLFGADAVNGVIRIEGNNLDPTAFVIQAVVLRHRNKRTVFRRNTITPRFHFIRRAIHGFETPLVRLIDGLPKGSYNLLLILQLGDRDGIEIEAGYFEVRERYEQRENPKLLKIATWSKVDIPPVSD